ncbi:FecCD family ABC transporter permease [Roseospira visakhapatnamensis]|uniref:Iron complex transport system permease protein n=1 Tax=Roseospira visakhapatnamensis TaxID=390880 RepID=A0A7W6RDU2_9PROT|nr:iron ABC transporter permease [Roseospira visakhapatnamensis]MBB4266502.1 iron complex transport system permease protein [Roseospira visakhapatnamensis]
MTRPFVVLPLILAGLALAGALSGLMIGYVPYGPGAVVSGLLGIGDPVVTAIVREVRLPRTLLALEVGAALGIAGAALQGLLRNPLAEPGLIGVSSSAALGAVVAFHFGLMAWADWALPATAIAGAAVTTLILLLIGRRLPGTLPLILTGIAVSSLAGALTSLALNLAPNPFALNEMVLWLMGSLKDRSMDHVVLALPFLLVGGGILLAMARGLDALTLGEETAQSLGVHLLRQRVGVVTGIALVVGAAVSVSGAIGFVGLVVPHMLRPFVGHQPSRLLLPSALAGAALVVVADTVARVLPTNQEVMVGVVTALLGAPFFLGLVLRSRRMTP